VAADQNIVTATTRKSSEKSDQQPDLSLPTFISNPQLAHHSFPAHNPPHHGPWTLRVDSNEAILDMSQKKPIPAEWLGRLEAMKEIGRPTDLIDKFGLAPHKVQHGEMEIWHYPLGVVGGMLYSIHVAVVNDDASQIYMHMEPSTAPDTLRGLPRRPWWRFW
jgi:hypothetical protein